MIPGKIGSDKHSRASASAIGKLARPVAEMPIGRRQVHRLGIVATGSDPVLTERSRKRLRVGRPNDVQVPDGRAPTRNPRQHQVADAGQRLCVVVGSLPPLLVPTV